MTIYTNPISGTLQYTPSLEMMLQQVRAEEGVIKLFENINANHAMPCDNPVYTTLSEYLKMQYEIKKIEGAVTFKFIPSDFEMTPYLSMYLGSKVERTMWYDLFLVMKDIVVEHNSTYVTALSGEHNIVPQMTMRDCAVVLNSICEIGIRLPSPVDVSNCDSIDDVLLKLSQDVNSDFYSFFEKVITEYVLIMSWYHQIHKMRDALNITVTRDAEVWQCIEKSIGWLSVRSLPNGILYDSGAIKECVEAAESHYCSTFNRCLKAVCQLDMNNGTLVSDYYAILEKSSHDLAMDAVLMESNLHVSDGENSVAPVACASKNFNDKTTISLLMAEVHDLREKLRRASLYPESPFRASSF